MILLLPVLCLFLPEKSIPQARVHRMIKRILIVVTLLVATIQGKSKMDTDFCTAHTKPASGQQVLDPIELEDYSFNAEFSDLPGKLVSDLTLYYSWKDQFVQTKLSQPFGEREFKYIFPKTDTYERRTRSRDGSKCTAEPLQGSVTAKRFQIAPDPNTGNLYLPASQSLVPNTVHTAQYYIGQEMVRGIPADRWHICAHEDWSNKTVSAEIYFNSLEVIMPGSDNQVPIMMKTFEKDDNTKEVNKFRYDLSYFTTHVDPNSKALEIPFSMYCENAVTANPDMPKMPDEFYFKFVRKYLQPINGTSQAPTYSEAMYDKPFKIISILGENPGKNRITKVQFRDLRDYNTGLQYIINYSTGKCDVSKIKSSMADDFKKTFGFGHMVHDYNYEYMGTHKHFDREIEADVYTAVSGKDDKKVINTWWFASKAYLKKIQYAGTAIPLRMRHEITNPLDAQVVDLFQYSYQPRQDQIFSDISMCYSPGKEMYISITLTARYDRIYSRNPEHFKEAFGTAMMKYSEIKSPLRIAQLRVEPADKSNTLVQFTLLDKPSVTVNAMSVVPEKDNSEVWTALRKNLDSGKFTLTVHDRKGIPISAKAIKYSKEFDNPRSFKVKQAKISSARSYSPGAVGGLGVGMFLVGLILGFGSLKVSKRYKDRVPDVALQNLGKSS